MSNRPRAGAWLVLLALNTLLVNSIAVPTTFAPTMFAIMAPQHDHVAK